MELSALRDNEHRCGQWEQDTEKKSRGRWQPPCAVWSRRQNDTHTVSFSGFRHRHACVFFFVFLCNLHVYIHYARLGSLIMQTTYTVRVSMLYVQIGDWYMLPPIAPNILIDHTSTTGSWKTFATTKTSLDIWDCLLVMHICIPCTQSNPNGRTRTLKRSNLFDRQPGPLTRPDMLYSYLPDRQKPRREGSTGSLAATVQNKQLWHVRRRQELQLEIWSHTISPH
jgi:hypothetical protein